MFVKDLSDNRNTQRTLKVRQKKINSINKGPKKLNRQLTKDTHREYNHIKRFFLSFLMKECKTPVKVSQYTHEKGQSHQR